MVEGVWGRGRFGRRWAASHVTLCSEIPGICGPKFLTLKSERIKYGADWFAPAKNNHVAWIGVLTLKSELCWPFVLLIFTDFSSHAM